MASGIQAEPWSCPPGQVSPCSTDARLQQFLGPRGSCGCSVHQQRLIVAAGVPGARYRWALSGYSGSRSISLPLSSVSSLPCGRQGVAVYSPRDPGDQGMTCGFLRTLKEGDVWTWVSHGCKESGQGVVGQPDSGHHQCGIVGSGATLLSCRPPWGTTQLPL